MRSSIALALLASLAACGGSDAVTCAGDADCPNGAACDPQQHVCMVGTATPADVQISAPASGAVADGTLSAVATAHAPGGVTSLSFEVRSAAGALFASAPGTAAAADPSSFSATVPLAGAADGSAIVQATIAYGAGRKLTSAPVQIQLDQRPPAITLQTDGRTRLLAGGQTATVTAQIGDGAGTGVVDSSVLLRIANHADVPGTGSGGLYSFTVPIDDSVAAPGATTSVPFQIVAADRIGHTASTPAGDPRAVLRIDRDKPRITGIAVTTPAPFTRPDGLKVFDPGAGFMKVQATISDGAGLDESTVCLRAAGEADPCPHLGTNHGAGNVYDFDLPPPAGLFDGDAVPFTLSADDLFAATLPDGPKAEHQGVSVPQPVLYDNTPPVVTVTADTNVYARTGGPIDVTATITDGTGLGTVQLVSRTAAPVTSVGNVFTFKLNAGDAPLGLEGPFAFQVLARDSLGHSTIVGASRLIDGAPPQITVLQIFKDGEQAPASAGVTYPAQVPNTGWTGSTFIYSDAVHVRGTLTDLSGVGSGTLHVDGIGLNGEVTRGTPIDLQCPGTGTCSFDAKVILKDVSGAFHSSGGGNSGTIPLGVDSIPVGSLQVAIDAQDTAVSFAGPLAPNAGTQRTSAQATRLLWEMTLAGDPATTEVSGLAIHPSGDVIVTTSGPAGDLYDLSPDQPLERWNGSAGVPVGAIPGTPAVGAGDAASARVYVASAAGVLYGFDANGGLVWSNNTGAPFSVGPAVAQAGAVDEIVIPDAAAIAKQGTAPIAKLWRATSATDVTSVASDEQDLIAAPIIVNGGVYFATQPSPKSGATATHVTMHPIDGNGSLGAFTNAVTLNALGVNFVTIDPFFGLVTDGTKLFAATSGSKGGSLFSFDPSFAQSGLATLASALSAEPTFGPDGKLYASDVAKNTSTFDPATLAKTPFVSPLLGTGNGGGVGLVPLHGSNGQKGHTYFPRNSGGALFAFEGTKLSWQFKPGPTATIFRYAIMDCQGRLFAAASNTVYAFVTDDTGLADTPWPTLRRDSRNTGNAGAEKYGMRTATGCIQ